MSRGSGLNAWLYPDPEVTTRIVSANIPMANMSTAGTIADGSFEYVNEPFKYTSGDKHPAGLGNWVNRLIIDEHATLYMLSNPQTDAPTNVAPVFPTTLDPVLIAEALNANDFATLADTGAGAAYMMSKM